MKDQSLSEPETTQSQNGKVYTIIATFNLSFEFPHNADVFIIFKTYPILAGTSSGTLYVTTIDNEKTHENLSLFHVYSEMNSRHPDATTNCNSDHYLQPFYPQAEPLCEEVRQRKNPSVYSQLDSTKRKQEDSACTKSSQIVSVQHQCKQRRTPYVNVWHCLLSKAPVAN